MLTMFQLWCDHGTVYVQYSGMWNTDFLNHQGKREIGLKIAVFDLGNTLFGWIYREVREPGFHFTYIVPCMRICSLLPALLSVWDCFFICWRYFIKSCRSFVFRLQIQTQLSDPFYLLKFRFRFRFQQCFIMYRF